MKAAVHRRFVGLAPFLVCLLPLLHVRGQSLDTGATTAPANRTAASRPVLPPSTSQPIPRVATSQATSAPAANKPPTTQPASGYIATDMVFATTGLDGNPIVVPYDYKGKIVVVHFWATWCPSCAREVPYWVEAQRAFHDRGVEFVGLPTDKNRNTPASKVQEVATQRGMNWPQAYEDANLFAGQFQVNMLPGVFIVDGDTGRVLAQGYPVRKVNLAKVLNWLLAQRPTSKPSGEDQTKPPH